MAKITMTLAAVVAALFPTSEKAISEKLTQEEFNAFASETQEVQNRLDAQANGNQAVADDLTIANANLAIAQAALTTAQAERDAAVTALATANTTIGALTTKAEQWDAYKASLSGAQLQGDSTNGRSEAGVRDTTETARQVRLREMKARHPRMMEGLDVSDED